jgi:hypothetical protein
VAALPVRRVTWISFWPMIFLLHHIVNAWRVTWISMVHTILTKMMPVFKDGEMWVLYILQTLALMAVSVWIFLKTFWLAMGYCTPCQRRFKLNLKARRTNSSLNRIRIRSCLSRFFSA